MRLDLHYDGHHDEVLHTFSSGSAGSSDNMCKEKCQRKLVLELVEEAEEVEEE